MEPIRWTDYLAAIPNVHDAGLGAPNPQSERELFLKLPQLVASKPTGLQALWRSAVAEFFLLALVFTTMLVVATVVLNWSR
jgi:hypothetical protein